MPLHDWTERAGWEGLHIYWMTEIARALRATLPPGYRAVIGSSPLVAIGSAGVKPDVAITNGVHAPTGAPASGPQPDVQVAVATLEEDTTVTVEREGRLVAAVELISPRNKDRPGSREQYAARYLNYLRGGVHLLLIDVHRRPLEFGFGQLIATGLREALPAAVAPSAVSYRVGPTAAQGGRMLSVWQYPFTVGANLPQVALPLTPDELVLVDLESTYARAAEDSYVT